MPGVARALEQYNRQTHDGYLWFGTHEGLARLDGITFTIFDMMSQPTMRSAYISTLLEDRAGKLWVATSTAPEKAKEYLDRERHQARQSLDDARRVESTPAGIR